MGRLRSSIRAWLAGERGGVLEAAAPYAKHLHHGTGLFGPGRTPILIEPRGKKALFWPGAKHPARRVRQKGIRPRDFLRRAARMYFPALRAFGANLRMETIEIFRKNYMKLKKADAYRRQQEKQQQKELPFGTLDKYFHCKANCEAAQLGYVAEAVLLSDVKEWYDLNIDNRFFGGQHAPQGGSEDQLANRFGRAWGSMEPYTPCSESCSGYRPYWLPEDLR